MSLVLPKNYKEIEESTKWDITGGSVELPMSEAYLNKVTCTVAAASLLTSGQVTGMTAAEIAAEIYAHAYVAYNWTALQNIPIAKIIYNKAANGISLEDGGDKRIGAKAFYSFIWNNY